MENVLVILLVKGRGNAPLKCLKRVKETKWILGKWETRMKFILGVWSLFCPLTVTGQKSKDGHKCVINKNKNIFESRTQIVEQIDSSIKIAGNGLGNGCYKHCCCCN